MKKTLPMFLVYSDALDIIKEKIISSEVSQKVTYAYVQIMRMRTSLSHSSITVSQAIKFLTTTGCLLESEARTYIDELIAMRLLVLENDLLYIVNPEVEQVTEEYRVKETKSLYDKIKSVVDTKQEWQYLQKYVSELTEKEIDTINGVTASQKEMLEILHVLYVYKIHLRPKSSVLRQAILKIRATIKQGYTYLQLEQCVKNVAKARGWWYDRALEWTTAQFFQNNNDKMAKLLQLETTEKSDIITSAKKFPDWKFRVRENFCKLYHGGGRFEELPVYIQDNFIKELTSDTLPLEVYDFNNSLV